MLSTHWQRPHTPTEEDFRLFDVLARQAADLIERTLAEETIRESEELFRLIANTTPVTIWMVDTGKQCTYVNQSWLDFTGQPLEAALGDGWADGIHREDAARSWETYAKAFDRREPFQMEYRIRRYDGEFRWVRDAGAPRYNRDGSFAGYIGSAMDVTERRLAEEALSAMNQRLIEAQEEERAHLARELHDDINQRLALLTTRLSALAESASTTEGKRDIEETRQEVMNLTRDIQGLSHRLHPPRLEYLGIGDAAAGLCREISSQQGVQIRFQCETVSEDLPKRISVCLYRVLQESLQNATKHSGAAKIEVYLYGGDDQIELTIQDSGIGFDFEEAAGCGLGLTSMQERLKSVNGQLTIDTKPQRGTLVRARVPLPQK